jgi:hypothetical protein
MRRLTPVQVVVRGALAGAAGTVAMDIVSYALHRSSSGNQPPLQWEFGGPSTWDAVAAPAQVGRRLYEGYMQRTLDERWARLTNNVMHWGYGMSWGAAYGIVAASAGRQRLAFGPMFGTTVWASSYVSLPLAGLFKPIWKYSVKELAPDLLQHLAYGTGTALAFRILS